MDEKLERKIKKALLASWSVNTSFTFSEDTPPSYGQCAQTAIVIQDKFGGDIHKTDGLNLVSGLHFYNFIDGKVCDFTVEQFDFPGLEQDCEIHKGIMSNRQEAMNYTNQTHVSNLSYAFNEAFAKYDKG